MVANKICFKMMKYINHIGAHDKSYRKQNKAIEIKIIRRLSRTINQNASTRFGITLSKLNKYFIPGKNWVGKE